MEMDQTRKPLIGDGIWGHQDENVPKINASSWARYFLRSTRKISKLGMNASSLNILLFLAGDMNFGNKVTFRQEYIARELDMERTSVVRGFKELRSNDIMRKVAGMTYMINPEFFFRSRMEKWPQRAQEYSRYKKSSNVIPLKRRTS